MYVLFGDAHYGVREKTSGQTDLINILTVGAMDKTSDQPQVMPSLLNRQFFEISTLRSNGFNCCRLFLHG
jgi:hypothetical protein